MFKALSLGCFLLLSPVEGNQYREFKTEKRHIRQIQKRVHGHVHYENQAAYKNILNDLFVKDMFHKTNQYSSKSEPIKYYIIPNQEQILPSLAYEDGHIKDDEKIITQVNTFYRSG